MKKNIVIKLGGAALSDLATLAQVAELIKGYGKKNYNIVLVHGGGPAINEALTARGISWKFIEGQRQTTSQMMEVIEEVLGLQVNSKIVDTLQALGVAALNLESVKHNIFSCDQLHAELGQVGRVTQVNTAAIELCFEKTPMVVPVIAPIGRGAEGSYNINADVAAAEMAKALKAEKLIFLTDQLGILDENKQLVKKIEAVQISEMIKQGVIAGGMLTKVRAMESALAKGVNEVRVLKASHASQLVIEPPSLAFLGTVLMDPKINFNKEELHVRSN